MKKTVWRRFILLIGALACALVCALAPIGALGAEDGYDGGLIENGDFSYIAGDADLPAGWQLICYDDTDVDVWLAIDEEGQTCLCLQSYWENDIRACQDIAVEPDAVYCISADICTEEVASGQGATLSVDNYSIDGTYCYSDGLFDTGDWTTVRLYVQTGPEQDTLRVALRLGGYGRTSTGTVGFRNVSVTETPLYDGQDLIDLAETASVSGSSSASGSAENGLYGVILASVAVMLLGVCAYLYIARQGMAEETGLKDPATGKVTETGLKDPAAGKAESYGKLALLMAAALILRMVLSLIFVGHSTDINCFMAWGYAALHNGLSNFYTSGMFADYPPGYMYICAAMYWLSELFGFGYYSDGMVFLFKLPSTVADLVTMLLIYRLARKRGLTEKLSLILAALVGFTPVIAYVTGAWGQIESMLVLGIALSFWFLQDEKPILAGAVYGLTVLLKPQALMFGPILAVAYFCRVKAAEKPLKQLLKTVLAVVAALGVIGLLSLPFRGDQPFFWIIDKYLGTSTSYPYASIEAFNFPALLGDNWASVDKTVLGVPYTVWGPIMIGLGILFASVTHILSFRERDGAALGQAKGAFRPGSLYLSAACMMAFLFTFGYYMHERYLMPVLLLLLIAFIYEGDRRLLIAFFGFSLVTFLNAAAAMYIVDHAELRGALYNGITRFGGLIDTGFCLYLVYVTVDILWRDRKKEGALPWALPPLLAPEEEPEKGDSRGDAPKRRSSGKTEILRLEEPNGNRYLTKKDMAPLIGLTLVYAVCALFNLGTLSAPETYWETSTLGEGVTFVFSEPVDIGAYSIYGNIAEDGVLLLESDTGETELYTQTYDEMFRWDEQEVSMEAVKSVRVSLYAGSVKINELAFFDGEGNLLTPTVSDASDGAEKLFDEQDTVPVQPSYYNGMYFDELYHGRTAYEHLHNLSPYENSHPPLGKIIISIGIALFGMCPFGWRVMGALFGIGMVPILYVFGKRLFRDTRYAFLAAALFAFDFMHFTQTRIATIDVYAVFFILLMYLFMYEYITMNFFVDGLKKTLWPLAACGVSFGLGMACKWISAYAGVGLAVLFFGSLLARWGEYCSATRGAKGVKPYGEGTRLLLRLTGHDRDRAATKGERETVAVFPRYATQTIVWCCLFFLLVPFCIYFLSYIPYYRYEQSVYGSYTLKDCFSTFWRYQNFMYSYHSGLTATHPYQSSWWQWPFTLKPMWYYSGNDYDAGTVSTLTASGNPAVWWISTVGAVTLLFLRLTGRVKKDKALQIFCVGVCANLLPWVLVTRCTFIYHFFATVPFILLATVYLLQWAEGKYPFLKPVKWVWLGLALLFFVLLYPGLSGYPVDADWAAFLKTLPGGKLMYGA